MRTRSKLNTATARSSAHFWVDTIRMIEPFTGITGISPQNKTLRFWSCPYMTQLTRGRRIVDTSVACERSAWLRQVGSWLSPHRGSCRLLSAVLNYAIRFQYSLIILHPSELCGSNMAGFSTEILPKLVRSIRKRSSIQSSHNAPSEKWSR